MKKVLLVTTKYGDEENGWLTNELANELKIRGLEVYVIALSWLKKDPETNFKKENGINVFRYKLPSIYFSNIKILKFIKQFIFQILALRYLKKNLKQTKFDLIVGFTPAFLTNKIIEYYQKKSDGLSYLILWDFFPYYLKDLKVIKSKLLFNSLKNLENKSYKAYTKIGCMTEKNKLFLLENYQGLNNNKIEKIPIWTKITSQKKYKKTEVRKMLGYNEDDIIFCYGGAHSIVQELDNILNLAKKFLKDKRIKFVFIGSGNDKDRLKKIIDKEGITNVKFLDFVPRNEYEKIIGSLDIGIVSLSSKLTVPSFPSKSLDYLKVGIPILASIDKYTDYGEILENQMFAGFSSYAGDLEKLYNNALKLIKNKCEREKMGNNGRKYYENNFCVQKIAIKITTDLYESDYEKDEKK